MECDRRTAVALLASTLLPIGSLEAEPSLRTRLILLGTAGGPRIRRNRANSAQAIVTGGKIYIIDCGYGVARQMVLAGLPLPKLRHVFITHHHSDHDIELGPLLQLAWLSGLTTSVDCWGPPPLQRMLRDYLRYEAYDIDVRTKDEGRVPFGPLLHAHELRGDGAVMEDESVRVTAAKVYHPPIDLAFAYRFDAHDRSIVISGDTRPSLELVRLAKGADVLVHEAMLRQYVGELVKTLPGQQRLTGSILSHHTTAEQAGQIATEAGVKMLVLSHLVPAGDPDIPDAEWIAAAARYYSGPILVGRDLMEI
jgi:ribonuclease BN (tRNA processing enzyme)